MTFPYCRISRPVLALVVGLLWLTAGSLTAPASARSLTAKEQAGLAAAVKEFTAATFASNYNRLIDYMPPKLLEGFAKSSGTTVAKIRATLVQIFERSSKVVKIEGFTLDLDKAQSRTTSDGAPYVFIPTSTTINMGQRGRIISTSKTLAFMDGGNWYLLRIAKLADAQRLQKAYPRFSNVTFEKGTMRLVKPK